MTFLPPVVMEIRANAAQFLSEQNKVIASAKATATATEAAAQKEAAAARTAAAAAKTAADQQVAAADVSAKAAQAASDKRILAETRATEAQKAAVKLQVDSLGVMTEAQAAAYDTQIAKANAAASAAELAASREAAANDKAAASATAAASAQAKAADAQVLAAEKSAAAAEVGSTRTATAMGSIVGIANKVSAATLLIGAGVAFAATDMAAKFEKSTMLLVTAGGESMNALGSVRTGIMNIAEQTGTSTSQLSEGMYVMEKAGYRGADGLNVLKAAAEGAKAENVDLATMTQAVTDVLLDYGKKASDAVPVTNMMVAASGAAKTTMQDFANSMAAVIPIGSAVGLSFEQLGGAIATMTQHGESAQQSSQNLANLIQQLQKPSNIASGAMQQLGIDSVGLSKNLGTNGLSGTLRTLSDAVTKSMGPDGMVVQDTMKKSALATQDLQKIMAEMPPALAKTSQGLLDGSTSITAYTKGTKGLGGEAGALGLQFLSLYKQTQGVNDAIKGGQPAFVTYNAEMTKLTGGMTGFKAATMLMMNDQDQFTANIKAIGDAGKKTGQDISTWADTQSTLSVQMDQTKQMVGNLGIEIGSKLVPVAKNMLGGFSDLFHGFEQGNPILLGAATIIGGALTISAINLGINMAKAGIKTVTTLVEMGTAAVTQSALFIGGMLADEVAVSTFSTKAELAGAKVRASLGNMTGGLGALGVAGVAVAAGMAVMAVGTEHAKTDMDQLTKSLADFAAGSAAGTTEMDSQFSKWDTVFGGATSSAHGLDDAIKYISQQSGFANGVNSAVDGLAAAFGQAKSETGQTLDKLKDVGTQLGQMVQGGSVDMAAKAFDQLALKFTKNGKSAQDALNTMPAYAQALKDNAAAAGQQLSQQELLEYAMGKVPQKMLDAMGATQKYTAANGQVKPITPALQKSLDDAGVSADGLVVNVDKILPAMEAAGLATVSTRDATSAFNKAIDDANGAVSRLVKGGTDVSNALNDNASDFNLTTDAGRQLNEQYEGVMKAGEAVAKQAAGDGVNAQADVQKALQGTYDNLVNSGHQMGIVGGHADDLARQVMGIPPGVSIQSWMDDTARQEAAKTKEAVEAIPPVVHSLIDVTTNANGAIADYANAVAQAQHLGGRAAYAHGGLVAFASGGMVGGYPGGGLLSGPGSGTSDSMLARVSNGEFIMRAAAVQKYGPGFMSALNKGTLAPSAGYVGAMGSASPSSTIHNGGASHQTVQNINVSVQQTNASGRQIASDIGYALLLS